MKLLNTLILSFALLSGCATTYQKNSYSGGYSETQLDENVFKVSFRGNGYTGRERVADFTLLRSAELSIQHGYNYFVVIDSKAYTSNSSYTTPTTYNTTANVYTNGNYGYGNATTTSYGGQTYNISKPSSSNTILCFKDKPKDTFSYNSKFIMKSLMEKYNLQKNDDDTVGVVATESKPSPKRGSRRGY